MFRLDMNAFKKDRHITKQLFFLGISLLLQPFLMNLCSSIVPRDDQSSTTSGSASLMRNRFSGHLEPLFPHYRSTDAVVQLLSHSDGNPLKTGGQQPPNAGDNFPDKLEQNLFPSVIRTNGKTTGNEPRIGKSPAEDSSSPHSIRSPGVDRREPDAGSMTDEGCSGGREFVQQNTIRNWDKKAPISTWENTNGQETTLNEKCTDTAEHGSLKNLHSDVLIAAPSSSSSPAAAASSVDPNRMTHARDALVSGHVPPALALLRRLSRAIRNQQLPMAKDEGDALLKIDSDKLDSICSGPMGTGSQQQLMMQDSGSKLSRCDKLKTFPVDSVHDYKVESSSAVTSTEETHGIETDAKLKNVNELSEFKLFDEKMNVNLEDFNDSFIVNMNKTEEHASNGMGFRTGIDWIKGNQNAFVDPHDSNRKHRLPSTSPKLQQVLNTSKPLTWLYSLKTSTTARSSSKVSRHLVHISTDGVVGGSYDDGRSSSVAAFNQQGQVINSDIIDEMKTISYDDALKNVYSTPSAGLFQHLLSRSTERYERERSSPFVNGSTTLKGRRPLQTPASLSPNRTDATTSVQETYARNSINRSLETSNNGTQNNRISQGIDENCLVDSRSLLEISGWKFAFQSINFISSILFVAACGYSALGALLATKQLKTAKACDYRFRLNCLLLLLCLCHVISGFLCGAWTSEFYEALSIKVLLSVTRICFTLSFLVHCLSICKLFALFRRCRHSILYFASVGIAVVFFLVDILMKIFLPKCAVTTYLSTGLLWILYCMLSASVFGMHLVSFRGKAQSISRYWIETELDADSKETVFIFASLVSRGLRYTNTSAALGLCFLLANICDIGFRHYGQRQYVRAVMFTAISNAISVAYCFTLAVSCRRLQAASEERRAMKSSESCSAVSIARDSTTLTKSSLSLSRGRTLDNISSLLCSEQLVFASPYSKFRSKTLSRGDVRSGDSRTRNSESLPLNNRNSDGVLIQRSLADGAVQEGTSGRGYLRDSKRRSMLFNDNGFIRFRKESDPDECPCWSDANAATSDDSTDCQTKTTPMIDDVIGDDVIGGDVMDEVIRDGVIYNVGLTEDGVLGDISSVIQQPKRFRPGNESGNGGSLHLEVLQRILDPRTRSLVNSQSSTPLGSRRSYRSSACPSPNLSGYRLPLIHLQESIDRALNDLSLKQVDADSTSQSMI